MSHNDKRNIKEILKQAKKIAYYSRVSTKEQDEESRQTDIVREFLKHNEVIVDFDTFSDTASAYSKSYADREKLNGILTAIGNKKFDYDAIVVSDRDRISRQVDEHFTLRELFKDIPVIIASKNDLYTEDDLIKTIIEDAMTKLESDNISTRTKHALKALLKNKKYIGGRPPYGFEYNYTLIREGATNSKNKVIEFTRKPEEIDNVITMFRKYKDGDTFYKIAKWLAEKYPEKKNNWHSNRVKSIILNPIYMGYLSYGRQKNKKGGYALNPMGEWIMIECPFFTEPAPVSREDWTYCYEKYKSTCNKPNYLNTSFWLSNLLTCNCTESENQEVPVFMKGDDQRTEIKSREKPYGFRYYKCVFCGKKIFADTIEEYLLKHIEQLPTPDEYILEETLNMLASSLEKSLNRLNGLKKMREHEVENVALLNKHPITPFHEDVLLYKSDNAFALAHLISKSDSLNIIKKLDKEVNNQEKDTENLKELLQNRDWLVRKIKSMIHNRIYLSRSGLRLLALLLVEKCTVTDWGEVKLKIRSMPPVFIKNYPAGTT